MKVLVFLLLLVVHCTQEQSCSVPGNDSVCQLPHGENVTLRCVIYAPPQNVVNSTVKWYKQVGSMTTEVVTGTSVKPAIVPQSNTDQAGLFQDTYTLTLFNVNSSGNGIYWCQIITDTYCLNHSMFLEVSANMSVKLDNFSCSSFNFDYKQDPLCVASNGECTLPVTTELFSTSIMYSTMPSTPGPELTRSCSALNPKLNLIGCLVIGVAVPVAVFVVLLIICCVGICVCRRKNRGKVTITSTQYNDPPIVTERPLSVNNEVNKPRPKKAHSYEQIDIESTSQEQVLHDTTHGAQGMTETTSHERQLLQQQPKKHQEAAMYEEIGTSHGAVSKMILADKCADHEYHELEGDTDVGVVNLKPKMANTHMYETVLSKNETHTNGKQNKACHEEASGGKGTVMEGNLSTSTKPGDDEYNVLDHSIVNNTVQKAVVREVLEESTKVERHYSTTQVHKMMLPKGSMEHSGGDNLYSRLGDQSAAAVALGSKQVQASINTVTTGQDHEYHVLEDRNTEKTKSTPQAVSSSMEVESELSANRLPGQTIVRREGLEVDSLGDADHEILFDDPKYMCVPGDKGKATNSPNTNSQGGEKQLPPDGENNSFFDDVQEVWLQRHT